MVIEFLTFDVVAHQRETWLGADGKIWTAYLSTMPGFIRKELWVDRGDPNRVHAAIWWQDDASWAACDQDTMRSLDEAMGTMCRVGTLKTFDVVA